jgi:hypothetical protein
MSYVNFSLLKKILRYIRRGVLYAQVCTPDKVDVRMLDDCELIGVGSGIYYGKHHLS